NLLQAVAGLVPVDNDFPNCLRTSLQGFMNWMNSPYKLLCFRMSTGVYFFYVVAFISQFLRRKFDHQAI
ncbi:MAG: hypothetical protein OES33_12010, partial [Desulfobulbaceae bacterium]|nr:hypothetical protein [Desulfobulbaceae bacterium]